MLISWSVGQDLGHTRPMLSGVATGLSTPLDAHALKQSQGHRHFLQRQAQKTKGCSEFIGIGHDRFDMLRGLWTPLGRVKDLTMPI